MKHYTFPVNLCGLGDNIEEAWNDAVEAFMLDPGSPPDESECIIEELPEE